MRNTKYLPRIFCALAATASLISCGGDDSVQANTPVVVASAPPATPPIAPKPQALSQDAAQIGACINIGSHLDAPNEGDWGRTIIDTDFTDIAAKGFKTVRLPVRFSSHASTTAPYTIDAAFMDRVSHVVDLAQTANLRVILDLHHYEELFIDPAGQAPRFAALWSQVAERFKGRGDLVWFELLNEPHDKLNHSNLLNVLGPALAEVRKTNPTRKVVIGGENWSDIESLSNVPLPNDNNVIVTFHYYAPFNFTHQGAGWITPPVPLGATYGSQADADQLALDVQKAKDFMTRTGRPLFIGEYGAYEVLPVAQRAPYYKAVNAAFKTARVDSCAWAYTNTFPFRNQTTGIWYDDLLRAIGL
jgi:endoglucanase